MAVPDTKNATPIASADTAPLSRRFSVAPMMDWTTPAYRYFARLISRHTLLYTEMVTTAATGRQQA